MSMNPDDFAAAAKAAQEERESQPVRKKTPISSIIAGIIVILAGLAALAREV
jgi:hypothetical protein